MKYSRSLLAALFLAACSRDTPRPVNPPESSVPASTPVASASPAPAVSAPPATSVAAVGSEAPLPEKWERVPDIEYVPTPQNVVDKMLDVVKLKKTDVLYDLGCGDGRIVVTAAKKYGVKAVGYDIDPQRVKESRENVAKNNVGDLVTIELKDVFKVDLTPASVVTLYLLPELNVKLIPQLEKLAPGSRIVSHDFDMEGVEPEKTWTIMAPHHTAPHDDRAHYVYLWKTPLKKTKPKTK
jgi:SAM-dependent methyltransferase